MKKFGVFRDPQEAKNWTQKQSVSVYEGEENATSIAGLYHISKDQKPQIKVCWVLPEAMQRHEIRSVICKFAGTHCSSQRVPTPEQMRPCPRGWEEPRSEGGRIRVLGRRLAGCPLLPVSRVPRRHPLLGPCSSCTPNRLLSASIGDWSVPLLGLSVCLFQGGSTHLSMKVIQLQKEPHIHFKNWTQEQPILVYEGGENCIAGLCHASKGPIRGCRFNFNILSSAKFGSGTCDSTSNVKHHVSVIFWHKYVSYW